MSKTHWKKLNNPNYLGAYSLLGVTDELRVKIKEVKKEEVKGIDGKKDMCIIAYLYNEKPMILNSTNCKSIAKIHNTPFIDDWKNLDIIIYVKKIKAFGEFVDALRVKEILPEKEELTPAHKNWASAKKAIKNGTSIEKIKKAYKLTVENEKLLKDDK
jgi:hypothetical protein